MKKFFKIFFIITVNIILTLLLAELACYISEICREKTFHPFFTQEYKTYDEAYNDVKNTMMVEPVGLEYNTRPIVIMGCSFSYGFKIDLESSFAIRLSKIMKRPVYNRGFEWYWGPQNMLYQARNEDFYNEVPNPEYFIFLAIEMHSDRVSSKHICKSIWYPYLNYRMKNGRLEEEKWTFWDNIHIVKEIEAYRLHRLSNEYKYKLMTEHFIEAKQEFDKRWKDYKFIVLFYSESENNEQIFFNNIDKKRLEENGIILLSTKEITGRVMDKPEDTIEDKFHPSPKAWEFITPLVAKKLETL